MRRGHALKGAQAEAEEAAEVVAVEAQAVAVEARVEDAVARVEAEAARAIPVIGVGKVVAIDPRAYHFA